LTRPAGEEARPTQGGLAEPGGGELSFVYPLRAAQNGLVVEAQDLNWCRIGFAFQQSFGKEDLEKDKHRAGADCKSSVE